jgi:hypothetical protein
VICIKQYGERRTGTNYLRAVLLANFRDVLPLMHVLGDKHSPPVAIDEYWLRCRAFPDAAWQFVTTTTFAAPAESTRPHDQTQLRYLQRVAAVVAEAVNAGELGYVLSVKHPCAWAVSIAKYYGWASWVNGQVRMHDRFGAQLEAACRDFNLRHRAWVEHQRRLRARCLIVRHEKLLENPANMVRLLRSTFGLQPAREVMILPGGPVMSSDWDHCRPEIYPVQFDANSCRPKEVLSALSPSLWKIVDRSIDWNLAADFGYERPDLTDVCSANATSELRF